MTSFSELGSLWTGPLSDPHRYRVDLHPDGLRAVGNGGEGLVYRASTVSEGRSVDVALKMLTTLTPDDYPRLAERAAALGNVIHPNVMRHLEVFIGCPLVAEDRTPEDEFELVYSAAAWVPGSPLEEGTSEAGPGVGLQWVGQIAEATDYLHRFRGPGAPDGFVHRDIKPSNVRVTPDSRAVLIDFGVARPHSTGDLTEGVGTYLWRAPEIVGGPGTPGKASDVWGVGALAFWAIVGEPPRLEGAELAAAKMREAAGGWDFRDPAALAAHVAALLETHPDRRPTDLAAWSRELRAITSGHRRRRSSWHASARVAGLAALGAAVVVGGLVVGSSVAPWGKARRVPSPPFHNTVSRCRVAGAEPLRPRHRSPHRSSTHSRRRPGRRRPRTPRRPRQAVRRPAAGGPSFLWHLPAPLLLSRCIR
jgi:serine/threonine protein kinase